MAAIGERSIERRNRVRPRLIPLHEWVSGNTRTSFVLLGGAVALPMSIVCANLSNLLLARATTRRREMALHMALGAGRGRLVRKLLCESLLLSGLGTGMAFGATGEQVSRELVRRMLKPITLGSAAGLLAALWLAQAVTSQPYGVSPGDSLTYGAMALVLVGSGLVAAYLPARRAASMEVAEVLRES